jgi:diaminopimelate decarboxylase
VTEAWLPAKRLLAESVPAEILSDHRLRGALPGMPTPAYVYDLGQISARFAALAEALPRCGIRYAVKANPHPAVLARLIGSGALIDASSIGEVRRALAAGARAEDISFTGPAKRRAEIEEAVARGIGYLVIESLHQAEVAAGAAKAQGKRQKVLARISPVFSPKGFGARMTGQATQFGIDEEGAAPILAEVATLPGLELAGLHFYAGSNALDAEAIAANIANCVALAQRFGPGERVILGSGFGLPYHEGQVALDLADVAARLTQAMLPLAGVAVDLELGRWLVGPAGQLLTRVVARKAGRGAVILMADAGFQAHMAACGMMGSVVRRNWPIRNLSAPDGPEEVVTLAGPLCTSIDLMARDLAMARAVEGDVLTVGLSGAYGATASPAGFISHPTVREFVWDGSTLRDETPEPGAIAALLGGGA